MKVRDSPTSYNKGFPLRQRAGYPT